MLSSNSVYLTGLRSGRDFCVCVCVCRRTSLVKHTPVSACWQKEMLMYLLPPTPRPWGWDHQYQVTRRAAAGHPGVRTPQKSLCLPVCMRMFVCVCVSTGEPARRLWSNISSQESKQCRDVSPSPPFSLYSQLPLALSGILLCYSPLLWSFFSLLPFSSPSLLSTRSLTSSCSSDIVCFYCTHARPCAHTAAGFQGQSDNRCLSGGTRPSARSQSWPLQTAFLS